MAEEDNGPDRAEHAEAMQTSALPPEEEPRSVANALAQKLGIAAVWVSPEKAVFTMPVRGNTQVVGFLHGGATAALCENAASAAANARAWKQGKVAVGTDISVSHLRPTSDGNVTATAEATLLGRRRTVHKVAVHDERGRLIATALVSNMIVEAIF